MNPDLNAELAEALTEWRDAGGPVSEIVVTIQAMIYDAIEEQSQANPHSEPK
jgi:hypothetical protein